MKNRPARVRELILRELGAIISREFTFTAKLVTVQAVDLTPDFKNCHVHVGVLGTESEQKKAIGKLQESRPHLQHELAKRVVLKFTPQLHFHLDEAIERGTRVMEVMRQIDEITPVEEPSADGEQLPAPQSARAAQAVQAMSEEDERPNEVSADEAELEDESISEDNLKTDSKHTKEAKISKGIKGHSGRHAEASPEDE